MFYGKTADINSLSKVPINQVSNKMHPTETTHYAKVYDKMVPSDKEYTNQS